MAVECAKYEGVSVCTFSGYIDTAKCLEDEKDVLKSINDIEKVIFDMKEVEYISSSFIRLCLKVLNKVKAEKFSIINVTPTIKRVFKISGLNEYINID